MDNEERAKRLDEIRYEIEHFDEIEERILENKSESHDWHAFDENTSIHELIKLFLPNGRMSANEYDEEKASKVDGKSASVKQSILSQEDIKRLLGD